MACMLGRLSCRCSVEASLSTSPWNSGFSKETVCACSETFVRHCGHNFLSGLRLVLVSLWRLLVVPIVGSLWPFASDSFLSTTIVTWLWPWPTADMPSDPLTSECWPESSLHSWSSVLSASYSLPWLRVVETWSLRELPLFFWPIKADHFFGVLSASSVDNSTTELVTASNGDPLSLTLCIVFWSPPSTLLTDPVLPELFSVSVSLRASVWVCLLSRFCSLLNLSTLWRKPPWPWPRSLSQLWGSWSQSPSMTVGVMWFGTGSASVMYSSSADLLCLRFSPMTWDRRLVPPTNMRKGLFSPLAARLASFSCRALRLWAPSSRRRLHPYCFMSSWNARDTQNGMTQRKCTAHTETVDVQTTAAKQSAVAVCMGAVWFCDSSKDTSSWWGWRGSNNGDFKEGDRSKTELLSCSFKCSK